MGNKIAEKYIAFIGDFKKLIPMGYTFTKMFANNYKCYHKGDINHDVWIWVAGKTVEVHDFHSLSYLFVDE